MKSVKRGSGSWRRVRSAAALILAATVLSTTAVGSANAVPAGIVWSTQGDFENNESTTATPTARQDIDTASAPGSVQLGPKQWRNNGAIFRNNQSSSSSPQAINTATNRVYTVGERTVSILDASTNETIGFIPMIQTPSALLVSTRMNKLYASSGSTIWVYDLNTNEYLKTIDLTAAITGSVYDSDAEKVYLTHENGTVSVIDGAVDEVTATVTVGVSPAGGVYNPADKNVYVLNDHDISIVDGASNEIIGTITVNDAASTSKLVKATINTAGSKIYAVCGSDLQVIDVAARKPVTKLALGGWMTFPFNVAYDGLHNKVYVSIVLGKTITVINAVTDTILKTIPYETAYVNVDLACSSTSGRLYAAEYIIDTATDTIVGKQKNLAARNVTHDPDGNKLYAMSDDLLVINALTGKMEKVVKIKNPSLAVVNPNGKKLFVLEEGYNYISILDTTTYETLARVALPFGVSEGVYNSVNNRMYFFQMGTGSALVLDAETGARLGSFPYSYYTDGKAVFQPATNKIYIGGMVVDCATDAVVGTVSVKGQGTASPNSSLIYFPYNGITVFDSATDQVVATFGSTLAGKENFGRIALDAAGNRLIASTDTTAYVMDATSGDILQSLPLPTGGISRAFFNDSNKKTLIFRMFQGYSTIGGVCDLSDYATRGVLGGDAAKVALRVDTHDITGGATLFDAYSLRYSYEKLMPGQHIRFRVRSAATQEGLAAVKYVGPDGTAATWYDETAPGALTNAEGTETVIPLFAMGTQAGRFIEIETALTANGMSPRLDEVKLELSAVAAPTSTSLQQLDEAGAQIVKPIKDSTVAFRVSGIPAGYFAQFEIRPKGTPFTGELTATGATADASGNSTVSVALPEGEYQWQARLALNADSWTAWTQFPGALTIDRTPPAMGIKGHTIMGTLEAGARVTVMAAAPLIVEPVQYPTATTWNCTITNLAPGVNQVVVTVSDEAGNLTYTTLLLSGY
jgi:Uncharacterized conserved protein